MRVTEKLVNNSEEEGVILQYIRLTKDFEEIKEYVQHKGEALIGYTQNKERVSVRVEDILYFETVDGRVFAYTVDSVSKIVYVAILISTAVCDVLSYLVKWYLEKEEADKINRRIAERRKKKANGKEA